MYNFNKNSEFFIETILLQYCNSIYSILYCVTIETILFQWGVIQFAAVSNEKAAGSLIFSKLFMNDEVYLSDMCHAFLPWCLHFLSSHIETDILL